MGDTGERIAAANDQAVSKMKTARPVLIDIRPARDVIPGMTERTILHAGPPIQWDRMCGPIRGAVIGALLYEGIAADIEQAEQIAASNEIHFSPCHHHKTVGPMAGVVSPSMWVFVVENLTHGNRAYCTLNEGLGKVLRFGAYAPEVIDRLKWMAAVLAPGLASAIRLSEGIDLKSIISRALLMGDEVHNRNVAGTALLLQEVLPYLLDSDLGKKEIAQITRFITDNPHFFLNLSMPASKATADTIFGMPFSTIMCAMARNGTDIGIRVAGLGDRWFTAPAGTPQGLYFAGFNANDANPDLGDSTIVETAGVGAFAMAAAPAIVKFVGGKPADAIHYTHEMAEICATRHTDFMIPALDFAGTPLGLDIRKVVELNLSPIINTGIAHRKPGIGQIGAGILRAPLECFQQALIAFGEKYA